MSTVICLKDGNNLFLATDSRYMTHDFSAIASDAKQKIFAIASQTFIAPNGWKVICDFQRAKAREIVGNLGTTDIRIVAEALALESIPHLEALAELLRSIGHLHEKIQGALEGRLTMHVTVLAGRTARGELGYVAQSFRIQGGRVVREVSEYFGDEGNIYTSSGDPAQLVVRENPGILNGGPVEVIRNLLAALKRVWPSIGGEDQIVCIDGRGARWISRPPVEQRSIDHRRAF